MTGEWRVEGVGRARVGANRLHADPNEGTLLRQPLSQLDVDARRMRAGLVRVEECLLVIRAGIPARAVEEPGGFRQRTVLPLEPPDVIEGQEVVGIRLRLLRLVDHDRRADQPFDRNLGDVVLVLTGNPVDRGVEVGARVLAAFEPVPVPGGPFLVVAADLMCFPGRRVGEGRWKLDNRRPLRKGLGQVDDVDRTGGQAFDEGREGVDTGAHSLLLDCSARGNSKRFSSMWTSIKKLFGISASTLATMQVSWSPLIASSAASSKSSSSRTICARGKPAALAIPARSVPAEVAVVNHW